MTKENQLFIDGIWRKGEGTPFTSLNPATQQVIWAGTAASSVQIEEALTAAKNAYPSWSRLTFEARAQTLHAFSKELVSARELLAEAISVETGKPLWEAQSEVTAMIKKIPLSIEAYGERCRDKTDRQLHTRHRAHGVLAVFGPFNLPGHLPNGHIVPALLAGNSILFKPSELTPRIAFLTMRCWEKAGIPKGVLNLIQGGPEIGKQVSLHPDLDGLLFTGSREAGQHLAQQLALNPGKIVALEMGGNNPLVVGRLKNVEISALIAIQSAFITAGQRCTCARRLIVIESPESAAFIDALQNRMQRIQIGPHTQRPEPYMGPLISSKAANLVLQKYQALVSLGGVPLVPLKSLSHGAAFLSPGLIDMTPVGERPDEEVFGPLLQLVHVDDLESALEEANKTQYGLAAGILTDEKQQYDAFYSTIRAGIVNWNVALTGASSAAPFGGIKRSGNHRPSAWYAADYCSYPVASLESETMQDPQIVGMSPGNHL